MSLATVDDLLALASGALGRPLTADDHRAAERLVDALPAEERRKLATTPEIKRKLDELWVPVAGPQTMAMDCLADELLYGGQGGGGKTDLVAGLALTQHRRSLIMRRHYTNLGALIERVLQIHKTRDGFNGSPPPKLRTKDGRLIEFAAAAHAGDEQHWQGQAHDLLAIDEATQFAESQIRFLMGWVRTVEPDQRCRVVLATNPPLAAEGEYMMVMFAPWLDDQFPDPARPGELRWYIFDPKARKDRWVSGGGQFQNDLGELVYSKSRSYIKASVKDNPYLGADYQRQLDQMQGPERAAVRDGNWMATRRDHEYQVIPTDWIRQAQGRWLPDGFKGNRMTALASDVAQGGADETVLSWRYGTWFAPLEVRPGVETPDPPSVAGLISMKRRDAAVIVVDVGGGYGGGVVSYLKDNEIPVAGFNASHASSKRTQDGQLGFYNKRAEAWWRLREALDPGQEGGSPVALPAMDNKLVGDLSAPRWKLTPRGIQLEDKDRVKERIGRSPDRGDAVVMCWSEGQALAERKLRGVTNSSRTPVVNVGHANLKRRRG